LHRIPYVWVPKTNRWRKKGEEKQSGTPDSTPSVMAHEAPLPTLLSGTKSSWLAMAETAAGKQAKTT
jgi:hypothetical protein